MRLFAIFALFVYFFGLLHAQDIRHISCRFLCFGCGKAPPAIISVSDKGADISCPISENMLSHEVVCNAQADTIAFISSADRKPAAVAKVSPTMNHVILIFVPGEKTPNALPWRVLVIEDSAKNFPDGGLFVANFFNNDIRMRIGDHTGLLHAGGQYGFPMPGGRNAFNMAPIVFQFQQNGQWRTASESMLRFLKGMRYLVFAYVDPASGRPRISTIQDNVQPSLVK